MPEPPEPEQPQPALEQLQPMPEPPEPEPEIADPWVAALSEALGVVEDDLDAPSFVAEPPPVTPDPDKTDPLPKREPQWVDSEVNHEPPPLRQPSAPEPKYEPATGSE